jgi:hypothetical protein
MSDHIEQRLALLEKNVSDLWKCVDDLFALHGRQSPRWAHDQRKDMADYYARRRKAMAS